jgi:radical SAM superfamily enzyme YgiQ (UPF0313 family)
MEELEKLYNAGWRGSVFITDDNLIGNKKEIKLMLKALISWQESSGNPFRFLTQASINLAENNELLQLMSDANFYKVFIGIETMNQESLEECGKEHNVGINMQKAIAHIHNFGLQVMAGFIIGFDHDLKNIFELQKDFIQSNGIVIAMVGLLTALPQTKLWHKLKKEDRLRADSTSGNTDGNINFVPKNMGMSIEEIKEKYGEFMKDLYQPDAYYQRVLTFIGDYKHTVKGGDLGWRGIQAFLKSVIIIGIFSCFRVHYWRLLKKTARINKKALPEVIELIIDWYDFHKIAKELK